MRPTIEQPGNGIVVRPERRIDTDRTLLRRQSEGAWNEQVGVLFGNEFRMARNSVAVGGKTRLATRHQRKIQMGREAARNVRCARIPSDIIGQRIRIEA